MNYFCFQDYLYYYPRCIFFVPHYPQYRNVFYNSYHGNYHQPMSRNEANVRGSWTPFSWAEKYAYAFSGPYNKAEVALTFDDGPDLVHTPRVLDKLKTYGVKATFFLLGESVEKHPEVVKRMVAEGHVVGNHTYNHPNLVQVSDEEYHSQILRTGEIIQGVAGYFPKFFRPTYGSINENQVKWATEQGLMIVQWSIDTLDWQGLSAETITENVLANAFPGSVILQHSAPAEGKLAGSVDALDQMIPQLQAKDARFVTLPQMFGTTKER